MKEVKMKSHVFNFNTKVTRAILNYALIGEYIFANYFRFAYSLWVDLSPSIEDFVDFLKKHPNAFAFFSQKQHLSLYKSL